MGCNSLLQLLQRSEKLEAATVTHALAERIKDKLVFVYPLDDYKRLTEVRVSLA